jgi:membrane carboxypeptidase/penicillin-binding protein
MAAEHVENSPSTLRTLYLGIARDVAGNDDPHLAAGLSWQIARTLFCQPAKQLNRSVKEFRTAIQIERRFTKSQILII